MKTNNEIYRAVFDNLKTKEICFSATYSKSVAKEFAQDCMLRNKNLYLIGYLKYVYEPNINNLKYLVKSI